MRRSPVVRLVAVVLAILASLTAPGTALAHGYAHHREHDGERHGAQHHGEHELGAEHHGAQHHGGDHHRQRPGEAGVARSDARVGPMAETRTAVAGVVHVSLLAAPAELVDRHAAPRSTGTHGHPTLDLPPRPRPDVALAAVATPPTAEVRAPEVRVPAAVPVPHAALPRADPDAEPPPRLRAPPAR